MIWRDQIVLSKKGEHFVINETLKNVAARTLFPFLCMGTTLAFFHSWGNLPSFRQSLKIIERGLKIEFPHSFVIGIVSTSWPCALFGSKWLIILGMLLFKTCIESRSLFVSWGRSVGKTLLLLKKGALIYKKMIK